MLPLCESCASAWERRVLGIPLSRWLRTLKPPVKPSPCCPLCGTTPETIRTTGLYGCCFCYRLFPVEEAS